MSILGKIHNDVDLSGGPLQKYSMASWWALDVWMLCSSSFSPAWGRVL